MSKVVLTGDFHIGAKTVDIDEILTIKRKYWKGKDVALMGDLIDAGLDRGMQFDNKLHPQQQFDELEEVLEGLNIVTALIGNHEHRIFKYTGLNIYKILNIPQLHEFEIDGKRFYITLGKGSAQNPLTEFTKLFRFVDADYVAMGHNHDLGKWVIVRGDKPVTLIRTGSFLNGAVYALENAYAPRLRGWVEVNTTTGYVELFGIWKGKVVKI